MIFMNREPTQAFRDQVIPLNRWYPYGRGDGAMIYPTKIIEGETSRGPLVEHVVIHGIEVVARFPILLTDFIADVRHALPRAISRAESMAAAARRYGYGGDAIAQADREVADLIALANENKSLPADPMPFESGFSADVIVKAGPEASPETNLWGYIDGLTGGCCNTQMRSVAGETFWEGTWKCEDIVELVTKQKMLTVVAASPRMPPVCASLFAETTRQALSGLPLVDAWRATYQAEHDAWIAPRKEQLLSALQVGTLDESVTLIVPDQLGGYAYHDCAKGEVQIDCQYFEADGDNYHWRVAMTGRFSPEGELESVTGRDDIRGRDFTLDFGSAGKAGPRP